MFCHKTGVFSKKVSCFNKTLLINHTVSDIFLEEYQQNEVTEGDVAKGKRMY